jgi:RNA polymerase sigma-70 factor (ECF subfamily)
MSSARPDRKPLLRLARAGDAQALGQLLEGYRNYLELLARLEVGRRLQGKLDPADLVQETFLGAYDGFGQFRGTTEEELLNWLRHSLASNIASVGRRYWGTQRRNLRLERQLADEMDRSSRVLDQGFVAKGSSPSHQAARHEQAVLLADAMKQLPEHYREVIILRQLEGLRFPEVAKRLGRSVDGTKKLWIRALARLRLCLGGRP